jgi:hypothetical protein
MSTTELQRPAPPPIPPQERTGRSGLWILLVVLGVVAIVPILAIGALVAVRSGESEEMVVTVSSTPADPEVTAPGQIAPDGPVPGIECPVSGVPIPGPQAGLPQAVADKRNAIIDATMRCEIERLADLTAPGFTASFGGGDPVALWTDQQDDGEEPLGSLMSVLSLPYGTIDGEAGSIYVWPSAYAYPSWSDVPDADRQALSLLYDADQLAGFDDFGGYAGYRVGIDADGSWLYFVAGD